jgi:uncharacterized RDD family membrane protein YckC
MVPPTEYESASVLQRVIAQCIDAAVTVAIIAIPLAVAPSSDLGILFALSGLVYRFLGDGIFKGAALGKRAVGIYVADDSTKMPCSLSQAAIRTIIICLPFVFLIEVVVLVCDGQRRWGDHAAHTYVLRRKPKSPPGEGRNLRPLKLQALRESLQRSSSTVPAVFVTDP